MSLSFLALVPSLLFVSSVFAQGDTSAPTATVDNGPIRGTITQLPDSNVQVNQFLSIPFARPPIDNLRFSPPQEPESWTDVLDVRQQPNACMQYYGPPGPTTNMSITLFNTPGPPGESEDCLYLNVYVPQGGQDDKPVLFWIYGGSGTTGAVSEPIYDGTSFAANQDIIVVAANYRVNVFGSPRAPQFSLEENSLARLDQRMALEWVQRNIAAFGGDPSKVTVMGESAGGFAVGNFVNTYPDDPPFRAAVEMSGTGLVDPAVFLGLAPEIDEWAALMDLLNCTNTSNPDEELECARSADAQTIMTLLEANNLRFANALPDNTTALSRPDIAWSNRNIARVPLLIGHTYNDGSIFVPGYANNSIDPSTLPPLDVLLTDLFGLDAPTSSLLATAYTPPSAYTTSPNPNPLAALSQIVTDIAARCPARFAANFTSTLLAQPAWRFVFNATVPSTTWPQWPNLGVYHASEVALVFGTFRRDENTTAAEEELSRSLQRQFAAFVRDPAQGPGWDAWPTVGVLGVDATGAVVEERDGGLLDAVCAFYEPLYLRGLPALAGLEVGDGEGQCEGDGDGEGEGGDEGSENAAMRYGVSNGVLGIAGVLMVGLVCLW